MSGRRDDICARVDLGPRVILYLRERDGKQLPDDLGCVLDLTARFADTSLIEFEHADHRNGSRVCWHGSLLVPSRTDRKTPNTNPGRRQGGRRGDGDEVGVADLVASAAHLSNKGESVAWSLRSALCTQLMGQLFRSQSWQAHRPSRRDEMSEGLSRRADFQGVRVPNKISRQN